VAIVTFGRAYHVLPFSRKSQFDDSETCLGTGGEIERNGRHVRLKKEKDKQKSGHAPSPVLTTCEHPQKHPAAAPRLIAVKQL
jgi:hypothetical protein